jgi:hypothetical protein
VTWDGLGPRGVEPLGSYTFRVVGQASGAATQAAGSQSGFLYADHLFPIRGRRNLGYTDTNNFGGGRGHKGQDMFARCGTRLAAARPDWAAGLHRPEDRRGGGDWPRVGLPPPLRAVVRAGLVQGRAGVRPAPLAEELGQLRLTRSGALKRDPAPVGASNHEPAIRNPAHLPGQVHVVRSLYQADERAGQYAVAYAACLVKRKAPLSRHRTQSAFDLPSGGGGSGLPTVRASTAIASAQAASTSHGHARGMRMPCMMAMRAVAPPDAVLCAASRPTGLA